MTEGASEPSMYWGLGIEVDFSLPSERVIRSLEQIIEWRGKPIGAALRQRARIHQSESDQLGHSEANHVAIHSAG
jgi:hypothetical protein